MIEFFIKKKFQFLTFYQILVKKKEKNERQFPGKITLEIGKKCWKFNFSKNLKFNSIFKKLFHFEGWSNFCQGL